MGRRLFKKKKSVFFVVLVVFLAVLIPMYILGLGIYRWGSLMTKEEITNSQYANVDFYMGTLESEISRIRKLQYECLNDENLFYFVNASAIMNEFQRDSALLSLQKRLSVMKNSSGYIKQANVYLPRLGKMISAEGGVDDLTDEWEGILREKADASPSGIIYARDSMYLGASYPLTLANSDAVPLYVLIIELSTQDIQDRLLAFNSYLEGGAVLRNDSRHFRLESGQNAEAVRHIPREAIAEDHSNLKSTITIGSSRYLLVGKSSDYLNMQLLAYIPETHLYSGMQRYQMLFVVFSLAALVVVLIFALSAYRLIQRPMKRLVNNLTKVEQGDLTARIKHRDNDQFVFLYSAFNNMAESLEILIDQNYKQQLLTQKAELKQLQAQINPHFLYNSFFILYRMAKDEDYDNITKFLTYLSDYYRFITRNDQMEVPLDNEVTHARNYAEIQFMRFNKRMTLSFGALPTRWKRIAVPRLILQPVIENAFEHGLKDIQMAGRLEISFFESANTLVMSVEDNGVRLSEDDLLSMTLVLDAGDEIGESTGLVNIHRRLRLKFGEESGLTFSRGKLGGLRTDIKIVLKGMEAHV